MKTKILLMMLFVAVSTFTCKGQDVLFIEFSEAMDTIGLKNIDNYELRFAPNVEVIILSTHVYPVRIDSIGFTQFDNLIMLFTGEHPDTVGVFQVRVFNVFDLAGNEIDITKNIGYY